LYLLSAFSNCNRSDFWTPTIHSSSNTVLRHLSTVPRSTVKFKSTSIGFRQTYSQAKGHLSFSFKRFPESSILSKAEILSIRTTSHKVIILGNQFPESGLHDAQSIAKADSNKKFLSVRLKRIKMKKIRLQPVAVKLQSIQNLQTWNNLCHVINNHNCERRSNSNVIM
jgi:hypothetical protein